MNLVEAFMKTSAYMQGLFPNGPDVVVEGLDLCLKIGPDGLETIEIEPGHISGPDSDAVWVGIKQMLVGAGVLDEGAPVDGNHA